jgi:hypothetical protein
MKHYKINVETIQPDITAYELALMILYRAIVHSPGDISKLIKDHPEMERHYNVVDMDDFFANHPLD